MSLHNLANLRLNLVVCLLKYIMQLPLPLRQTVQQFLSFSLYAADHCLKFIVKFLASDLEDKIQSVQLTFKLAHKPPFIFHTPVCDFCKTLVPSFV